MLLLHDGTKPTLRPYQQEVVSQVHQAIADGFKRPAVVASCGAGKTLMSAKLIEDFVACGFNILFFVDLDCLVPQTAEKLEAFGIDHGFIKADYPERRYCQVQIGSAQTMARRSWWKRIHFDVIIYDEAHKTVYSRIGQEMLNSIYPDSLHIALTATPWRTSKRQSMGDFFNTLILAPMPYELQEMGYLVPMRYYTLPQADLSGVATVAGDYNEGQLSVACNRPELVEKIASEWHRITPGKRTIAFAVDIAHATAIAQQFDRDGIPSGIVTGDTPKNERNRLYQALHNKEILVLSSVNVVSIGFDLPSVEVGITARPTESAALFHQQLGRVMRISHATEKSEGVILDQSGNLLKRKTGFVLPEQLRPKHFSLKRSSQVEPGEAPLKPCESHDETGKTNPHGSLDESGMSLGCGVLLYSFLQKCPHCGYKFPERAKAQLTSNLVELSVKRQERAEKQGAIRSEHADHIDERMGCHQGFANSQRDKAGFKVCGQGTWVRLAMGRCSMGKIAGQNGCHGVRLRLTIDYCFWRSMGKLSWRDAHGHQFKILHLNDGSGWVPYTAHPVANVIEQRNRPPGDNLHSKGWFAYQFFFKQGWEVVSDRD
jgi:superfamily II DNA or RNA helicase